MLRPFFYFILLSLSWASSAAIGRSSEEIVDDFKLMARKIPLTLQSQGYRSFGRLNLSSLFSLADSYEILTSDWIQYQSSQDKQLRTARSTAQWERTSSGKIRIQINQQIWPLKPIQVRSVIALHEYLGPAGFYDHDYVLSTSLWFLASATPLTRSEKQELIDFITSISQMAGGGITGVGGGGDVSGVELRLKLLQKGIAELSQSTGPARNEVLSRISQYFRFNQEALWASPNVAISEYQSAPAEIASEVQMFRVCQKFLKLPSIRQREVFQILSENYPKTAAEFSNANGLKKFCLSLTSKGQDQ